MRRLAFAILVLAFIFPVHAESSVAIAENVETAHGLATWWTTKVLRTDISISFGEGKAIDGTVYFETNGPRARLDLKSGERIVYDGQTCWVSPANSKFPRPRFHVLTWPWFIMAPFKIRGDGTHLTPFEKVQWAEKEYWAATQTFDRNSGDSPDDWYYLYIDPESYLLKGMGYIVTFGQTVEKAKEEPHGIIYDGYIDLNGAKISTSWKFCHFSKDHGINDPLGTAKLKNPEFIDYSHALFAKPENAREEKVPSQQ